jgi:hypothetical protein
VSTTSFAARERVDERGLADVGPDEDGELGAVVLGQFPVVAVTRPLRLTPSPDTPPPPQVVVFVRERRLYSGGWV